MVLRPILPIALAASLLAGCGCMTHGSPKHHDPANDFTREPAFKFGDREYPVLTRGSGPPVLVLHELPGMTPQFLRFARMLSDRGFRVYAPLLFGQVGERLTTWQELKNCRGPDFRCTADRESPELSAWLAAYVDKISNGGRQRIGVIGMCMTGNLAIALMSRPGVAAAVASQPAIPMSFWGQSPSLGLAPETIKAARDSKTPLLALRFTKDCLANDARFATLRREFPPSQITFFEIDPVKEGFDEHAHAVLTEEYVPATKTAEAVETVFRFLERYVK